MAADADSVWHAEFLINELHDHLLCIRVTPRAGTRRLPVGGLLGLKRLNTIPPRDSVSGVEGFKFHHPRT